MIQVRCGCGKRLNLDRDLVGKLLSCRACQTALRVVAPDVSDAPVESTGLLIVRAGPTNVGEQIFLAGTTQIQIGKLPGSDILLQSQSVSRTHCRLEPVEGGWRIEDEASTNGVYVNRQKIVAQTLMNGDRVRVGDYRFKYVAPADAAASAVPVSGTADSQAGSASSKAAPQQPPPGHALPVESDDDLVPAGDVHVLDDPPSPVPDDGIPIAQAADDDGTFAVADDEWSALAAGGETVVQQEDDDGGNASATHTAAAGSSHESAAMADEYVRIGRAADRQDAPRRSFWANVVWTPMVFGEPGNLIMLVLLWGLFFVLPMLSFAGCLGLVGQIIVGGWICSYLFNVILEAASGEDDLPSMSLTEGWLDDVVVPLFKFLLAWGISLLPAIICAFVVATHSGATLDEVAANPGGAVAAFGLAAALAWPIVVLVMAIGGVPAVIRVDLMVIAVFRAFPSYIAVCVLIAGVSFVQLNVEEWAAAATTGSFESISLPALVVALVKAVSGIAGMRVVGLYYHHYKHKFPWAWE